jgi:hypothetical protein
VKLRLLFLALLLTACAELTPSPPIPPTPTPLSFTSLNDLLGKNFPVMGASVTTLGYLVVDEDGARLLNGLSFGDGTKPEPLTEQGNQIWVATDSLELQRESFRSVGTVQYAVVLARGQLEGPASYGPDGRYRYHLRDPQIQTIVPEETNIATLNTNTLAYEGRVVRVTGALLSHAKATLLVENIGPGGIPADGARQLKVRGPIQDRHALAALQQANNGIVFGRVQIEGFWRQNELYPLSIKVLI